MTYFQAFMIIFVTLGPIRPSLAFFALGRTTEPEVRRAIATRAVGVATLVAAIIVLLGAGILGNWRVQVEALEIAGGIILFLGALQLVLAEEKPEPAAAQPPALTLESAIFPWAVPTLVTPQGIVALIALDAAIDTPNHAVIFIAFVLGVMVLNYLALVFADKIYAKVPPQVLKLVVRVLGVLLAGLAVQIVLFGFDGLGLIPSPDVELNG